MKLHAPLCLTLLASFLLVGQVSNAAQQATDEQTRPNILLIIADDLNWDSIGIEGSGGIEGLTPHIDGLAGQSLRFEHAHVTTSACWPSRHALLSGRYAHRSGGEGFAPLRFADVPILPAVLHEAGYRVGAIGKTKHSKPHTSFEWDLSVSPFGSGQGRNPRLYAECLERLIDEASAEQQPFFLMANSHDPHRPFNGQGNPKRFTREATPAMHPARTLKAEDITVPAFLPDLPGVREDVRAYYESVGRCDETVGALLGALKAKGQEDNTVVIFLSDNGMAFPMAKANCYRQSTRTPLILRWPGHFKAGEIVRNQVISGVDLMPTLLGLAKVELPAGIDGRSFQPILLGEQQPEQAFAFTQYFGSTLGAVVPMRAVQGKRFGYNFNPWADGKNQFIMVEYWSTPSMEAIATASASSAELSAYMQKLVFRTPEELYDYDRDPHGLNNVINDPEYKEHAQSMRDELEQWMVRVADPALGAFRQRSSPAALREYVDACRELELAEIGTK
jgi:N-sulfoglucosamine sulfohydrolase